MTFLSDWFQRFKQFSKKEVGPDGTASTPEEQGEVQDRGILSINRSRSIQSRVTNFLAIGLMSALGLGLLVWYYSHALSKPAQSREHAQATSQAKAQGETPLPTLGRIDPPQPESSAVEHLLGPRPDLPRQRSAEQRASDIETPAANVVASGTKSPGQIVLERRLSGPVLSLSEDSTRSGLSSSESTAAMPPRTEDVGGPFGANSPNETAVGTLLKPSVTPAVRARILPTQRMLLPKGAFIDCTLETAIDTSLAGFTTCITATDTFSADGKVVLLERGTKLVGETRGEVRQGSARIFVLWTEARTPTGVVVPLASPGTDELGRSGLPGQVDRHFFDRFGAAILISLIDGAIQAGVQSQSKGGGSSVIYNPSSAQDILTEVLKSTINIPPTVFKRNGDRIQILVARDLDFRSVYDLRTTTRSR